MKRALAVIVAIGATAPAQAATTVGVADLGRWTPNLQVGCAQEPYFGFPTGASTCTYYTASSRMFSTDGSNIVPRGYGVITKVRVKTASIPQGSMQVVTFRASRHSSSTGNPGCCWPQYATKPFTPAPGTVTEIATRLPVMNATLLAQHLESGEISVDPGEDAPPPFNGVREVPAGTQGIENFDQIGLTVLEPGAPIPATNTGESMGPAGAAFFPGLTDRSLRVDVAGLNGVQVLLQAVWEPDADRDGRGDESQDPDGGRVAAPAVPTPAPATPATAPPLPAVTFARSARLSGRKLTTRVRCALGPSCSGRLSLSARAGARPYGSARFSIAGGRSATVKLTLKRKPRGRSVIAMATMGHQVATAKLTLRRR